MKDKKRPGPKTRPTGIPPGKVRKAISPVVKLTEDKSTMTAEVTLVKWVYTYYRRRWEQLKRGSDTDYRAPAAYDGMTAATINDEGPAEGRLAKARPNEWHSLVTWCRKFEANPLTYVAYQFDNMTVDPMRAPEPHQLRSDVRKEAWLRGEPKLFDRFALSLRAELSTVETEITVLQMYVHRLTKLDTYAKTLTSPQLGLSPLFRYVLAAHIAAEDGGQRFSDIAARYENDAIVQYWPYAVYYDKAWSGFLPVGFAVLAAHKFFNLVSE